MFNAASEEVPGGGASGFDEEPGEYAQKPQSPLADL